MGGGGAGVSPRRGPASVGGAAPAMTLATEPMRRMEPPSGSTLLPGRVSPYPSTTDSSPRTTATTRPGAPELSHRIAPLMEAATLRTGSPARALARAPARTSARLAARLFALGVIGPLDTRSLSRGCLPWPSTHSQRKNPDPTGQAGEGWGGGELKGLSCCVPLPVPPAQAG